MEVAASEIRDRPGPADVAQQAALWRARPPANRNARWQVTVREYTSKNPEALDKYYDGMAHYAVAEMDQALPLFEETVHLDPSFAQAHNLLAMAMFPGGRYAESFREIQMAKDLAEYLPERKKAWILSNQYTLAEDPGRPVQWPIVNKDYFPDEPRYLRVLARVLCHTGKAAQSIMLSRIVLELTPKATWRAKT